jgi:hypothetical protein
MPRRVGRGPDIFDPFVPFRIDGKEALRAHYAPVMGTVRVDRYEMVNPAVETAVEKGGTVAWEV